VWTVVENQQTGKTIYTCVMHPEIREDKPGKCPKCGMELVPMKRSGKLAAHRTFVSLGASDGNWTAVTSGLNAGDRVVYQGNESLKEGDGVTPTEWGESGPKTLPKPAGDDSTTPATDKGGMKDMPGMSPEAQAPVQTTRMSSHPPTSLPPVAKVGKDKPKVSGVYYTCPMHPEVQSNKPGKCPKCGMTLVKKPKAPAVLYTCPMHPEVTSNKPGKCPKCGMSLVPKKGGKS
jgi:ssDNA-binding Zn-finger/Zn-ribbon topoisomerase 1